MHGVMRALIARWLALIAMLGLLALVIATSRIPCVPYGLWPTLQCIASKRETAGSACANPKVPFCLLCLARVDVPDGDDPTTPCSPFF
jgi:hypothetical protein